MHFHPIIDSTKNKCGKVKVVAIERIKYKLVPVEVPRINYLPDKQLTKKELQNAWRAFEYSGIRNHQEEEANSQPAQPNLIIANQHPSSNLIAIHSNNHQMQPPSVIYQRYDAIDLEKSKDAAKDTNRDYGYKENAVAKLKRRNNLKRKVSKKVFYDYD